ncbi:MAG: glycosyltransferase [Rhodocyclales bacterium]|nr:glycosyltransferase [Rhodocyclales bacterium]
MRVLHVIQSLEFGGAEKVVVDLGNEMLEHCEVAICCTQSLGALVEQVDARITVTCLGGNLHGNDYKVPLRLARVIRDGAYDVVHSHGWNVYLEAAMATVLAGYPRLVHTVHGNYMPYPPGLMSRLKVAIRHRFERVMASRHHRIVGVSHSIRDYVVRDVGLPNDRVVTVHNGIACRNLDRYKGVGKTFVTVGRLAAVKNHAMMIRAFQLVLQSHPDASLLIVGDGPERTSLEALVHELGVAGQVSFLGFRQDVGQVLALADVFLMTSRYEGISIAVLEAMCAGLPVLATNVGGIPETVVDGATGILVPSEDVPAMASGMLQLLNSREDRLRLGSAGREFLASEFSIATVVDRYLRLYRGLT